MLLLLLLLERVCIFGTHVTKRTTLLLTRYSKYTIYTTILDQVLLSLEDSDHAAIFA